MRGRTYYYKNKEKCQKATKLWRIKKLTEDPEYFKKYREGYIEVNKHRVASLSNEYINSYRKRKISENLNIKLACRLRSRLSRLFKKGTTKYSTLSSILGCTWENLRIYLESKFQEGMNWNNYGVHGWHIDHIKPCSSFDLADPEQQKICFHYTNLQPLWAKDNLSKGKKLIKENV